jgi:hypothetical protein
VYVFIISHTAVYVFIISHTAVYVFTYEHNTIGQDSKKKIVKFTNFISHDKENMRVSS